MSDSKKKIYLGEDLVCQTFTDAEEQAKAFDLFGLEQPIVSSNAPASTRPVQQGQVCEFDGTNDFIEIFDNEIVPATFQALSDDIIIEAWIWRDSAGGAPAGWTMSETVCELRQIGTAAGTGIPFSFGIGSGKVGLGVTDDYVTGRQAVFGSTSLSLSTWYHIKVVISGDDYEFFLDGVSDGSGTLTTATGDRSVGASNASLSIGIRAKDSGVRESNHFDGKICGLKISLADGTVVIQQNLNHASGTTAFDSSGNGNDGTLQNGAAFVVDNTLPPEADRLNLDGYTDDSGVLIPRDESDPTNDIDGNPLQYSGSVYPRRPEYRNSYAASFDGVDDYISATHLTGSETVASSVGTSTPSISAGRVDFTAGTCGNLILSDGTHYPLTEGAGDTAYDISGNGNHGTINNASTGTEGAGFWAGRIDGEANALNNKNGFSRRMLFDGVNDAVLFDGTAYATKTKGKISGSFMINGASALNTIVAFTDETDTNSDFRITIQASGVIEIVIRQAGVSSLFLATTGVFDDGLIHSYSFTVTDSGNELLVDGVAVSVIFAVGSASTKKWVSDVSDVDIFSVGVRQESAPDNFFNGVVYDVTLYDEDGTTAIGQWNGYGNTDADWTDQIGSNDGTVGGSPALLRIPADTSDPTKDALGDTLTNPAITDGYNGAETELDAYNIAEGDNPSPATNNNPDLDAIEFGTDFAANDAAYMRLKSSTENDRLITFADDLTGGDETLAQKYTQ